MPYTKHNSRVEDFRIKSEFNSSDTAVSANCSAHIESRLVNDSDAADVVMRRVPPVYFNLLDPAISGLNITAATKTVTYLQLAALIRQACLDRANAQGVS